MHRWFKRPAAAYKSSAGHCLLVIMCTFTVFWLGRTSPHFRPNEGAKGCKAGYFRDLNSLRRVNPPIWRPAASVGVRWPIRWLHWGLAVLVSGFTLLWPKNHRVYPLLAVAQYFMAVRKFTNICVLLLILMVGSRDTIFPDCFT